MHDTTPRRTWKATAHAVLDGAVVSVHTYTVTAYRRGGQIVAALIDGAVATLERTAQILRWAQATGSLDLIDAYDGPAPIGNAVACQLHKDLGRLGLNKHYAIASEVLGREVASLAGLTRAEAAEVWSYACSLAERPTLPSLVFQGAAA